uniref:Mitochondrial carrier protein n=1 Tax=Haptolina brevifila TaxID=156173 RepID=A0A7S2BWN9_9EUKA|mmetsp:Transcript_17741/g.35809  ORF Transcript_17741/g.35809 Transcript_17741/m.35809 type:complete len:280 (+) Transcript_17741:146-985(+)|eukprot:CAMPEP_0174727248 /NCGR_PEP_ID=MMETSP1094-20130205/49386_1 /TAXON_ID=156173 /ORGANISM="Chrysochromulina brevifilum, Strain UTEX LB 985" /LENGTH=279 /DNA_ID=CAMNT_0015928941 /DNA_START=145 /DNA_END=984 /DNA_ORIENTATION=+
MGGGDELQRLSAGENCVLGATTGMISKAINYPFLVWKNTVQQGLPISLNPLVVYRGLPMACLNLGGTTAVQFATTGFFQRLLSSSGVEGESVRTGGAFLGGVASGIPCSVWELCMIQQQRFGGTMLGTPAKFISEYGVSSLTRGFSTTMGREGLFTMAMLGITPAIQRHLVETSGIEKNQALAVGALSGACFAGTLSHPLDTIKTCMQGDLGQQKYQGVLATGRSLAAEYGVVQGLFKGLFFRICLISTTFFLVNTIKQRVTGPLMFPKAYETEKPTEK